MKTRLALFSIITILCLSGCPQNAEEDISIGEITIFNIPAEVPVKGKSTSSPVFKVYLNASDSQSEFDPSVARGLTLISQGTLDSNKNTYTVTIKLIKPNPENNMDPDLKTDPWSGTANYFSVMISPKSVKGEGENAVWIKGGYTLTKGKANCDWDSLINFRETTLPGIPEKASALYRDIILNDSMIEK